MDEWWNVLADPVIGTEWPGLLIRDVDGITTEAESFKSFLVMIQHFQVDAQLIFQLNRVGKYYSNLTFYYIIELKKHRLLQILGRIVSVHFLDLEA